MLSLRRHVIPQKVTKNEFPVTQSSVWLLKYILVKLKQGRFCDIFELYEMSQQIFQRYEKITCDLPSSLFLLQNGIPLIKPIH